MVRVVEKAVTLVFDIVATNVALATAFWLRYKSNFFPEAFDPSKQLSSYLVPFVLLSILWIILYFFTGLYRDWYKESRLDEFLVVSRTIVFGMFLLFLVTSADQIIEFARSGDPRVLFTRTKIVIILTYGGSMLFFATLNRFTMHTILSWLFMKGIVSHRVLIVGASPDGAKLVEDIQRYPKLGYKVVGFIDNDPAKAGTAIAGHPVLGRYEDIPSVVRKEKIGGMIVSHSAASADDVLSVATHANDVSVTIYMVPSLQDVITGHFKTQQIFGVPLMVLLQDHMPHWQVQVKRVVDVMVSLAVLVIGAPIWLSLAAIIRLTSTGPALYKQERVGQYGKPFMVLKFRSMYQDAEKHSGPQWAKKNDPRITPIGRFIRKTRLDEIPQFVNVLRGEMSLVGPRPERQFFIDQLKKEIPLYVRRIKMKPGITGWAQVKHKYDTTIEDVKQKLMYDLYYFENMSLVLDAKIILRTIFVVVTGKGAH